tara:strand:- start:14711 stop:15886 length:1176 start_codon:yes stop_codon:yes gene_type:complete
MKISNTIKSTLFLALFIGIIVPMLLVGAYTIKSSEEQLYDDFSTLRAKITSNISKGMQDPLYYFSPNNASLVLEVIKHDEKISKIEVYDVLSESYFIIMDFPHRKEGGVFVNQIDVERNGEVLGWVKVEFNDKQYQELLNDKKELFLHSFFFTFLVSILILTPLLSYKILLPLKKLLRQSREFEHNKFELTYIWDKNDEINILGHSFEKARRSILKLIGELQDKNAELEKLYATDQLTMLWNRYKLNDILNNEMVRSNRYQDYRFGLIMVDLDHFKLVNDTYGHQAGDDVLCGVASIFKENIRTTDIAGRWGGEEFMLIISHADSEILLKLAEKIRKMIEAHFFENKIHLTASFGASIYRHGEKIEKCIARVDEALYQAKAEGRNKVIEIP